MIIDPFASAGDSVIGPARELFEITADDAVELSKATKGVYIGEGGDLTVRAIGSSDDVTLRNLVAGTVLAVRLTHVRATGTTAGSLVGFA